MTNSQEIRAMIGAPVLFFRKGHGQGEHPLAGLIVGLQRDTNYVNLALWDAGGQPFTVPGGNANHRLLQEGQTPPVGESYCKWAPWFLAAYGAHAEAGARETAGAT